MDTFNFISFHDLSDKCNFLWASPGVEDVFGYDSDEIVGMSPMEMILPDDLHYSEDALKENIMNDLVASQVITKFRHKDGRPVYVLVVFSMCYDMICSCTTLLAPPTSEGYHKLRAHSSAMTRMVETKKEEFSRIKRHHDAFQANSKWDAQFLEPEARVCLLLNRFTRSLIVMYASSACEKVLCVDPDNITGKPILLFIRSDDLMSFVEQMDVVKGTSSIVSMRFWFQSPNLPYEIPCEAVFIGGMDGILTVIRRYKPFVRKYFIGSREQYCATSQSTSRSSGGWDQKFKPSPPSLSYSSTRSSNSQQKNAWNPHHKVNRSTLNRIKIYELDDEKARPLACIPDDDPYLVRDSTVMSRLPEFRDMVFQGYDDDNDDDDNDDDSDGDDDGDDDGGDGDGGDGGDRCVDDDPDRRELDEAGLEYMNISEHNDYDIDM
ncbi:hypothetical protein BGX26_012103 [Mortierella sp. AD094]|nr:hypothetical protein BGX26_012103 [Mortierella sp. AD094]